MPRSLDEIFQISQAYLRGNKTALKKLPSTAIAPSLEAFCIDVFCDAAVDEKSKAMRKVFRDESNLADRIAKEAKLVLEKKENQALITTLRKSSHSEKKELAEEIFYLNRKPEFAALMDATVLAVTPLLPNMLAQNVTTLLKSYPFSLRHEALLETLQDESLLTLHAYRFIKQLKNYLADVALDNSDALFISPHTQFYKKFCRETFSKTSPPTFENTMSIGRFFYMPYWPDLLGEIFFYYPAIGVCKFLNAATDDIAELWDQFLNWGSNLNSHVAKFFVGLLLVIPITFLAAIAVLVTEITKYVIGGSLFFLKGLTTVVANFLSVDNLSWLGKKIKDCFFCTSKNNVTRMPSIAVELARSVLDAKERADSQRRGTLAHIKETFSGVIQEVQRLEGNLPDAKHTPNATTQDTFSPTDATSNSDRFLNRTQSNSTYKVADSLVANSAKLVSEKSPRLSARQQEIDRLNGNKSHSPKLPPTHRRSTPRQQKDKGNPLPPVMSDGSGEFKAMIDDVNEKFADAAKVKLETPVIEMTSPVVPAAATSASNDVNSATQRVRRSI